MADSQLPPQPHGAPVPTGPASASAPRVRPGAVEAVVAIQIICIALLLLGALASFLARTQTARRAAATMVNEHDFPSRARGMVEGFVDFSFVMQGGVYLLFAAFHLVLAILNWRGVAVSRILTWILAGISAVGCGGAGLAPTGIRSYTAHNQGRNLNSEFRSAVAAATPTWMLLTEVLVTIAAVVGSIWIAYLLARPSANAFFWKPRPHLVPVLPYGYQVYYQHHRPRPDVKGQAVDPSPPAEQPSHSSR